MHFALSHFWPEGEHRCQGRVVEDTGHLYDALSGSCKLRKASLATWVVERLERDGVLLVPIPKFMADEDLPSEESLPAVQPAGICL